MNYEPAHSSGPPPRLTELGALVKTGLESEFLGSPLSASIAGLSARSIRQASLFRNRGQFVDNPLKTASEAPFQAAETVATQVYGASMHTRRRRHRAPSLRDTRLRHPAVGQ
jgi:hypothetical protein